jgi:hypothetical protein
MVGGTACSARANAHRADGLFPAMSSTGVNQFKKDADRCLYEQLFGL